MKKTFKKIAASVMASATLAVGAAGMTTSAAGCPTGKWYYNSDNSEYINIKSSSTAYCSKVFTTTGNAAATGDATYSQTGSSSSMNEKIYYSMRMTSGNQYVKTYSLTHHRTDVTTPYLQVTHKYYK